MTVSLDALLVSRNTFTWIIINVFVKSTTTGELGCAESVNDSVLLRRGEQTNSFHLLDQKTAEEIPQKHIERET